MIQKMKKITLLALESRRQEMLNDLADLSVMHISCDKKKIGQGKAAEYLQILDQIVKADVVLNEYKDNSVQQKELAPQECLKEIETALAELDSCKKQLDDLARKKDQLIPWGDFDPASVKNLADHGIFVKFWILPAKGKIVVPDGMTLQYISQNSRNHYVLSLSQDPEAAIQGQQEVKLPDLPLSEIEKKESALKTAKSLAAERIAALANNRSALQSYADEVRNQLDFANADLSAQTEQEIVLLTGYIPEKSMETFAIAARENGWAYLAETPAEDDLEVPTYITKPKWLGIMDPLFDLIGIDPGYRENDVNAFFFLFFPIFFGLIIGDAGYGVLFLLTAALCKFLLRNVEKARLPLNLFLYLSCFSLGWGWLSGNWFGIPADCLPGFMRGWNFLSDPKSSSLAQELVVRTGLLKDGMTEAQINGMWTDLNNRIVQWLCFFLAALHLTSARIFKFIVDVKSDWRAWGNLGWALLLIANFLTAVNLIVFPGTFPATFGYMAYIAGAILAAITTKPQDLLNFPFSLIGSFTDILSYIRLFAVGLAGTCIAVNFNNMGAMLLDGRSGFSYFLALLAMILIVLFGHVLNIALSFLSVLAHGVRLNTLEFSGHVGMQWSGTRYKPFSKLKQNQKLENNNKENEK